MAGNGVLHVATDRVPFGARLAEDVRDARGAVLAEAGAVVDAPLRERLANAGCGSVPVQPAPEVLAATFNHVFRHWRWSPAMRQLQTVLMAHRLGDQA